MKICPQCNVEYEDSMFFCLEDGTPLKSTDNSVQTNLAAFEQTLIIPPPNNLSGEKTLPLISETLTEQKSVKTAIWQPETTHQQPIPTSKTNQDVVLSNYIESNQNGNKGKVFIIGGLLGGIVLIGTALGGLWFLQRPANDVAIANANQQPVNSNRNLGVSNVNLSVAFGDDNSNSSKTNLTIPTNNNSNKLIPNTSPTKDKKDLPTPTSTPTLAPTPIPKTPTPIPDEPPSIPKIVSQGVVNGKAVNLVKPPYPPAAKAVRASGAVNVQVTIDENGNVISASAVSGHPLLRAAAEQAARASKFSQTMLSGQKVKVTGVIVYNFTAQ